MFPKVDLTAMILSLGWCMVVVVVLELKLKSVDCLSLLEKVGSRLFLAALAEVERFALARRVATSVVFILARLRFSVGVCLVFFFLSFCRFILLFFFFLGNMFNLSPAPGS